MKNRGFRSTDRDKASKTGTVPAKTGRMVSLPKRSGLAPAPKKHVLIANSRAVFQVPVNASVQTAAIMRYLWPVFKPRSECQCQGCTASLDEQE